MNLQKTLLYIFGFLSLLLTLLLIRKSSESESIEVSEIVENSTHKSIFIPKAASLPHSPVYGIIQTKGSNSVNMRVSGIIEEGGHNLTKGSSFKKGDILIKLERSLILYQLLSTRSSFKSLIKEIAEEAEKRFPEEANKWDRYESVLHRTLPLAEMPEPASKQEEEWLEQKQIFSNYNTIKMLEKEAENHFYVAPFDGVIIESNVRPGTSVKKDETILRIAPMNFVVSTHLPLAEIGRYEKKEVEFYSLSNEFIGKGELVNYANTLSEIGTVEAQLTFPSSNATWLNQGVEIRDNEQPQSILLPSTAFISENTILIENDGKEKELPVEVLQKYTDSIRIKALSFDTWVLIQQ